MTAADVLFALIGAMAVSVLRDVLPVFVNITERIEQECGRNIPPHQKALGLASLSWMALRSWLTGRVAVVQFQQQYLGIGSQPRTRLLPRPVAFALGFACVVAIQSLQPPPPSPLLASAAVLALLLIALTSFDFRLVADGAVILVALAGAGHAVLGEGDLQQQALAGALVGLGVPWAIRFAAGLAGCEPFGYAIPKLGCAIGIWLGAHGAVLAIALASSVACAYWVAQEVGWVSSEETLPVGGFLALVGVGVLLLGAP